MAEKICRTEKIRIKPCLLINWKLKVKGYIRDINQGVGSVYK
jgi:hypothetical protein